VSSHPVDHLPSVTAPEVVEKIIVDAVRHGEGRSSFLSSDAHGRSLNNATP